MPMASPRVLARNRAVGCRIRDGGNAEELLADRMAGARAVAAQFPRLRARLDTAAADYAAAPEHSFEFGLQAILDGLEAQLVAKARLAVSRGASAGPSCCRPGP
ncbi:MAG: TetR/AcrR family transcriptional regulator C-terminal domain-containing protein [Actinomycetes bacterium]